MRAFLAFLLAMAGCTTRPSIRIWTGGEFPGSPAPAASPTASPAPSPMPAGAGGPVLGAQNGVPVTIRVSHYWPPAGGANCARFVRGRCLSRMASGERWEDWAFRPWAEPGAIACPPEWPFGTRLLAFGRIWVCLDRGSRIQFAPDGIPWVDFLHPRPLAPYGAVANAWLYPVLDNPNP